MLEVLLFLALAISCSFAANNDSSESFDPNFQILDVAANIVKEDVFSANALLAAKTFKPHVYTVLITEPTLQNPVQGVQDLWTEKIDPFLSPVPLADRPDIMKEIKVAYHHEEVGSTSKLLIACATIVTMILFFGSIIMIGSLCYIVTLKYSYSTSSFAYSEEMKIETHNVPFTELEIVDELSTVTDESDRTVVGNKSGTPDMAIDVAAPGDTSKGSSPVALSPTSSPAPPSTSTPSPSPSPPTSPPPPLPM